MTERQIVLPGIASLAFIGGYFGLTIVRSAGWIPGSNCIWTDSRISGASKGDFHWHRWCGIRHGVPLGKKESVAARTCAWTQRLTRVHLSILRRNTAVKNMPASNRQRRRLKKGCSRPATPVAEPKRYAANPALEPSIDNVLRAIHRQP